MSSTAAAEIVKMGEVVVRRPVQAPGGLAILGLGSCVAVFLHDPALSLGGLAHILLPAPLPHSALTHPGHFVPTAIPVLLDRMLQAGGHRDRLTAKIAGGAHIYSRGPRARGGLGDRNVEAVRRCLELEGIRVGGMDIGGAHARTLHAHLATGEIEISSWIGERRRL